MRPVLRAREPQRHDRPPIGPGGSARERLDALKRPGAPGLEPDPDLEDEVRQGTPGQTLRGFVRDDQDGDLPGVGSPCRFDQDTFLGNRGDGKQQR